MLFSVFSGFGAFKFSSKPTHGQSIYDAMVAAKVGGFRLEPGDYAEAKVYAQAMGLARCRYTLERARNQQDPLKAIELLPHLEGDWGAIPSETDTLIVRQQNVAAKMRLPRGPRRENVETQLRAILGTDFLALRAPASADVLSQTPTTACFARPEIPYKVVQLTTPVTLVGSPYACGYANLDVTQGQVVLAVGDVLTVQPENAGLLEVVTVVGATATTFTATFQNAHDLHAIGTTQNYVNWTSTQRHVYVVVKATSSLDAEKVRRVHDWMSAVCRGVSSWSVVQPTTPGATTIGPLTLGLSPLGTCPIGALPIAVT